MEYQLFKQDNLLNLNISCWKVRDVNSCLNQPETLLVLAGRFGVLRPLEWSSYNSVQDSPALLMAGGPLSIPPLPL